MKSRVSFLALISIMASLTQPAWSMDEQREKRKYSGKTQKKRHATKKHKATQDHMEEAAQALELLGLPERSSSPKPEKKKGLKETPVGPSLEDAEESDTANPPLLQHPQHSIPSEGPQMSVREDRTQVPRTQTGRPSQFTTFHPGQTVTHYQPQALPPIRSLQVPQKPVQTIGGQYLMRAGQVPQKPVQVVGGQYLMRASQVPQKPVRMIGGQYQVTPFEMLRPNLPVYPQSWRLPNTRLAVSSIRSSAEQFLPEPPQPTLRPLSPEAIKGINRLGLQAKKANSHELARLYYQIAEGDLPNILNARDDQSECAQEMICGLQKLGNEARSPLLNREFHDLANYFQDAHIFRYATSVSMMNGKPVSLRRVNGKLVHWESK